MPKRFSSYGPPDYDMNYHVPRKKLLQKAYIKLIGTEEEQQKNKSGHYITVWAPRQTGKTTIMRDLLWKIQEDKNYCIAKLELQTMQENKNITEVIEYIIEEVNKYAKVKMPLPKNMKEFEKCFTNIYLKKPLILILDEFDSLEPEIISLLVGTFRNIYIKKTHDQRPIQQKEYLLHGLALIGVRTVLGVENPKGSPFNVQQSLRIPNLTNAEVNEMFQDYIKENKQQIDQEVIDQVFYVTQGQPGLVSWYGELLTERYKKEPDKPITIGKWKNIYNISLNEPNNNILNIISKVRQEPYRNTVLEIYKTQEKTEFKYDDPHTNFLFMNGIITEEKIIEIENEVQIEKKYIRFPCQFVQDRLFRYLSGTFFDKSGKLLSNPFMDLTDYVNDKEINVINVLKLYQEFITNNQKWLFRDVPRRKNDLRIYEAIYHFSLYSYLDRFLKTWEIQIIPEFPTGNGKIDLVIKHAGKIHGLELKSFSNHEALKKGIKQASRYGLQLGLKEIILVVFIDNINDEDKVRLQKEVLNEETGVLVKPFFICTFEEEKIF